jgi:hypothetical protein
MIQCHLAGFEFVDCDFEFVAEKGCVMDGDVATAHAIARNLAFIISAKIQLYCIH